MYDLEKIKKIEIEDVARKLGMKVDKGHTALCPFHADMVPSLHFNKDKQHWKCYACSKKGDQITLVKEYLGISFNAACEWIVTNEGIDCCEQKPEKTQRKSSMCEMDCDYLEWILEKPRLNEKATRFLFEERHIDPKVVECLGLTSIDNPLPCRRDGCNFYDAPSLLIPYRDIDGRLMSVQGRWLGSREEAEGKHRFRFPPGSKLGMYNMQVLRQLKKGDELWIAEGPSDCWAMLSAGHAAIAVPSATLLMEREVELLREFKIHMVPDNDAPGRQLFAKIKELLPQTVMHELPEGVKDFGEMWKGMEGHGDRSVDPPFRGPWGQVRRSTISGR